MNTDGPVLPTAEKRAKGKQSRAVSGWLSWKRPLAGALLLSVRLFLPLAAVVVAMSSCLFPQDDRILDPLPPTLNRRPSIDYDSISPSLDFNQMRTGANCAPYKFAISVRDPDLNDHLSVRLYVDYDPSLVEYNDAGVATSERYYVKPRDYGPSAGERRDPPWELTFQPSRTNDPLNELGRHVIQVAVADGNILPGRQVEQPTEADGGRVRLEDGGFGDSRYIDLSLRWTVDVVAGECP